MINSYGEYIPSISATCSPTLPLKTDMYKVNVAGYSLTDFRTIDTTGYTILCRFGETCDGLTFVPST